MLYSDQSFFNYTNFTDTEKITENFCMLYPAFFDIKPDIQKSCRELMGYIEVVFWIFAIVPVPCLVFLFRKLIDFFPVFISEYIFFNLIITSEDISQDFTLEILYINFLIQKVIDITNTDLYCFYPFGFYFFRIYFQLILHFSNITVTHQCSV